MLAWLGSLAIDREEILTPRQTLPPLGVRSQDRVGPILRLGLQEVGDGVGWANPPQRIDNDINGLGPSSEARSSGILASGGAPEGAKVRKLLALPSCSSRK